MCAVAVVAGAVAFVGAPSAQAATLDCSVTPGVCTGGTSLGGGLYLFDGALWTTTDLQSTGTGVIDSFVRVSDNDLVLSGMNTDARPLTQEENSSPTFTHDIQGVNIPIVTIGGQQFYEFLLDINQQGVDPNLTISGLQLCYSGAGSQTIPDVGGQDVQSCDTAASTPFYTLPADDTVKLNYGFNEGSGSGDLFMYIPVNGAISDSTFVYLWSEFGGPVGGADGNNDGFEEWAVRTTNPISPEVPEPASLLLLGTGLASLGGYARRRARKAAAQA